MKKFESKGMVFCLRSTSGYEVNLVVEWDALDYRRREKAFLPGYAGVPPGMRQSGVDIQLQIYEPVREIESVPNRILEFGSADLRNAVCLRLQLWPEAEEGILLRAEMDLLREDPRGTLIKIPDSTVRTTDNSKIEGPSRVVELHAEGPFQASKGLVDMNNEAKAMKEEANKRWDLGIKKG